MTESNSPERCSSRYPEAPAALAGNAHANDTQAAATIVASVDPTRIDPVTSRLQSTFVNTLNAYASSHDPEPACLHRP